MSEQKDIMDPSMGINNQKNLPNSTAVLVLGILSIVGCIFYGIPGIICGIIAIVLHGKDKKLYTTDPASYKKSFGNSKAGFICGIVGLSLSILWFLYFIVILIFFGAAITAAMGEVGAM